MGREVVVYGHVSRASRSSAGQVFLEFSEGNRGAKLTAFINKKVAAQFERPPEDTLSDKRITIRGRLYDYRGKANLRVTSAAHVQEISADWNPPRVNHIARPKRNPSVVTIATYNILNLFDDHDDPYAEDENTETKPAAALKALASSIREIDADVLAVMEVENRGVLETFNREQLADMKYREVVLVEGNDGRGIDVALLSRFPVGPVTTHRHLQNQGAGRGGTSFMRDFLQVRIDPTPGQEFYVFVTHLKSQHGDAKTSASIREGEAALARRILDRFEQQNPRTPYLVCGDFNDGWDSTTLRTLRGSVEGQALVSFWHELPEADRITYNRSADGDMIDFILASSTMAARYVAGSYQVRHGDVELTGSDHNPVLAQFRLQPE